MAVLLLNRDSGYVPDAALVPLRHGETTSANRSPTSNLLSFDPLLTTLVALTLLVALALLPAGRRAWAQGMPITFSVIADVPYSDSELNDLEEHVADHNLFSPSYFLVHIGDIFGGSEECVESRYEDVAGVLQMLAVPAFILPGDNEWNDCSDPDEAWFFWETHFTDFESNFCGTPAVQSQDVRPENFAFTHSGVLFVGLNLVGGSVNNSNEWDERLRQDADWVTQQLADEEPNVRAAVVFGHAGPSSKQDIFFDQFVPAAGSFGKPVLFIHGDDHSWKVDRPFSEENILRVQLERGVSSDPPVHVTVTLDTGDPFLLERDPWPSGTDPFNIAPCVDVGPDVAIGTTDTLQLDALVTDDGVPTSTRSLILDWSKVSGPGSVSFGDTSSPTTTATFSVPGTYELRLTADDEDLVGTDELTVHVGGVAPPGLTLTPSDDARVRSSRPTSNYGSDVVLRAKLDPAGSTYHSYLKFDASGIGGAVQRATLRLFVVDASSDGGSIRLVSNDFLGTSTPWNEAQLTWDNAPALDSPALDGVGPVVEGVWVEFDVTAAITGPGIYSFGLDSVSSNSVRYSSKEGANPPQLVIEAD